jgi:hypothetical protein
MGEAVLDKADCAGADSSARRPQQGHQHLDRRPLARPSAAGARDIAVPRSRIELASAWAARSQPEDAPFAAARFTRRPARS